MARARWQALGPGELTVTGWLPLVALVSRPPIRRFNKQDELKSAGFWITQPHDDLRAQTLPTYAAAALRASYHLASAGRWRWGASYGLDLRRTDAPLPVASLVQTLTLEARRGW